MNEPNDARKESYGKLDVSIPEQDFEAGSRGVASIIIKNPFDRPIILLDVVAPQSTELKDKTDFRQETKKQGNGKPDHETDDSETPKGFWSDPFKPIRQFLATDIKFASFDLGMASISLQVPRERKVVSIKAEEGAKIHLPQKFVLFDDLDILAEHSSSITINDDASTHKTPLPEDRDRHQVLFPNSEVVRYLNIQSRGWLLFKPTKLSAYVQVSYRFTDDEEKTIRSQVIATAFGIRPPLWSNIWGGIVGALLGTLARELQDDVGLDLGQLSLTVATSIVMSIIATIALSRKTDSQGFITVEDFYGGFVLGALIGYAGSRYFEQAIIPSGGNE